MAEYAVVVALIVLAAAMLTSAPVALCLALSGTAGLLLLRGDRVTGAMLGSMPYDATASFGLVVIPMFVLMGALTTRVGLAEAMFRASQRLFGRLPGGLALATVAACAGFAAVSGSSNAMVATLGPIAVREMRRYDYSRSFAAGVVASAGTIGIMIPPSITLVIYAIITQESIGAMLIAGIVPGIVSAILYMVAVLTYGRWFPAMVGRRVGIEPPARPPLDGPTVLGLLQVFLLFVIVIGGIYAGFFTPTEAAALGAAVALLLLLLRVPRLGAIGTGRAIGESLAETVTITSFIFVILVGATIFTFFLVSAGVPRAFADWAVGLDLPPALIVALLLFAIIPLGMVLDPISIMLIVLPLAHPVVVSFGYSGVWFGILVVQAIEIGLVTPPVGINVFIISGSARVPTEEAFRGIAWFLPVQALALVLFFLFPGIATGLPGLMGR